MARLDVLAEAKQEISDGIAWYAKTSTRNSKRFKERVGGMLKTVARNPKQFGWYDDDFRHVVLDPYPYTIIYHELPDGAVQVIAVAHTSREPGYWEDRV